ncbi:hypothetical protein ORI94_04280 [Streptomyces sp. NEAU-W12]|nr:hypothetical protein [Streptomyces sp. NEAU-W12]MCX2922836.1 hypothetical protein [Streptomyces sp. NEAU-W12]
MIATPDRTPLHGQLFDRPVPEVAPASSAGSSRVPPRTVRSPSG